jgi:hypothetical protein
LLRQKLGFVDVDPVLDRDKSQHVGMVLYGNETRDRWSACPVRGRSDRKVCDVDGSLKSYAEPVGCPREGGRKTSLARKSKILAGSFASFGHLLRGIARQSFPQAGRNGFSDLPCTANTLVQSTDYFCVWISGCGGNPNCRRYRGHQHAGSDR